MQFFKLIFFTAGIRTADEITMVRPTNIWHIYKVNGVIYDGEFVSMWGYYFVWFSFNDHNFSVQWYIPYLIIYKTIGFTPTQHRNLPQMLVTTWETALAEIHAAENWSWVDQEGRTQKKFLAVDKACKAKVQLYSRLSKIQGRTFGSSGFSTKGIFISTTVSHCGSHRRLFKSLILAGWGVGGEEEEAELFISRLKTQGNKEGKCSRLHYAVPLACSV